MRRVQAGMMPALSSFYRFPPSLLLLPTVCLSADWRNEEVETNGRRWKDKIEEEREQRDRFNWSAKVKYCGTQTCPEAWLNHCWNYIFISLYIPKPFYTFNTSIRNTCRTGFISKKPLKGFIIKLGALRPYMSIFFISMMWMFTLKNHYCLKKINTNSNPPCSLLVWTGLSKRFYLHIRCHL